MIKGVDLHMENTSSYKQLQKMIIKEQNAMVSGKMGVVHMEFVADSDMPR